jgi:hypothetical protein
MLSVTHPPRPYLSQMAGICTPPVKSLVAWASGRARRRGASPTSTRITLYVHSFLCCQRCLSVTLVLLYPIVLFDIPLTSCRADKDQRFDIAVRSQVPQQGPHTNPYVLALGKLREPLCVSQILVCYIYPINRGVSPGPVSRWWA